MDDCDASREELERIEALVWELLGADPARCGEAHAELVALGGFSRPEVRETLDRAVKGVRQLPERRPPGLVARLPGPARKPAMLPGSRERRVVGTFELGACLGRGGFGFVYRGRDLSGEITRDNVCVKVANAARSGSRVVTRIHGAGPVTSQGVGSDRVCADGLLDVPGGFRCGSVSAEDAAVVLTHEFSFLREVDSDLFPEVYAAGLWDGVAYYAMELIAARDLRQHILDKTAGDLDWRRLFRRLVRELAALHDRRDDFFHGDLKPENILVTAHRLRLIDPAYRGGRDAPLTATLSVPYNPLGLSGERADTGALAITLLELLTGLQPLLSRERVWRPTDGLDLASVLPLEVYAPHASVNALVKTLVRWVSEPPSYVEFAAVLER